MTVARVARVLLVALALSGCRRAPPSPRPGTRTTCTCTYLTDFDDTAEVIVDVCVENGKKTFDEASFCAVHSAHNHIDKCDCRPPGEACDATAKDACVNR